jgi:hypothetical protein
MVLLVVGPVTVGWGQGQAVDLAELTRLSKLTRAEQLSPANQTRLQQWFFQQVGAFQAGIRTSALGRSALVNVGAPSNPPGGIYAQTFGPPSGHGRYNIFWTDAVTAATTYDDGVEMAFPRSGVALDAGSTSACWHESMHAVMNPARLSVRVENFATVCSLSRTCEYGEAQHHVYIELFAEKAAAWIERLAGFERVAVAAAERLEELKSHGQLINYEVEQFVWADSQAAWQTRWESAGKHIIRLPQPIKDEFERATSTRFPSGEEIIGFYMGGDFKAPVGSKLAGRSIKIPKWVMWPQPGVMPVLLEERDSKPPEMKGDVWNASFGVRFSEPRWQQHPPVTRGIVTFTLRSDEPSARLVVTYRGRVIQPSLPAPGSSWRRFVVDLGVTAPQGSASTDEPVRVAVSVKDSPRPSSARALVLPVHVAYRDDVSPKAAHSRLYLDTEGIFLVTLPATSNSPKPSGPPASPGQAIAPGDRNASTAPRWVLINQWTYLPKASFVSAATKWTCSVSDTGATVDYWASKGGEGLEWLYNHRLNYRWNFPAYLEPGAIVPLQIQQESTFTPGASMLNRDVSLSVVQCGPSDDPTTLQTSGEFKGTGIGLGGSRISERAEALPAKTSGPFSLQVPSGRNGERILIAVSVYTNYGIRAWAYRQYEWRPGVIGGPNASTPSGAAKLPVQPGSPAQSGIGSIEKQVSPPPPLDKALDEAPPKIGELDPWIEVPPPPPSGPSSVRWYTHPEGDYRIRLDRGWHQTTPSSINGMDRLDMASGGFSLFPSRQRTMVGNPMGQAEKLAAGWLSPEHKTRRILIQVAGETAVIVPTVANDNGKAITLWHILITRKDRLYYLSAFAPATTGLERLPPEITDLLSTLEFLTGAPSQPGKADIASLVQQGIDLHSPPGVSVPINSGGRPASLRPGCTAAGAETPPGRRPRR